MKQYTCFIQNHQMSRLALLISLLLNVHALLIVAGPELKDYCFMDTFNATCDKTAVIRMIEARYGRMTNNRCLGTNEKIGCSVNVLAELHRRCSGLHACVIKFPDASIHALARDCPKDRFTFLRAAYTCVKVEGSSHVVCDYAQELANPTGYIASVVTRDSQVGSVHCPWVIRAAVGQRINVSLVVFAPETTLTTRREDTECDALAEIRDDSATSDVIVCGGGGGGDGGDGGDDSMMKKTSFLSLSNSVMITITDVREDVSRFLLKYDVVGCADPIMPPGATFTRTGNDAFVSCGHSSPDQLITCVDKRWIGHINNCTVVSSGQYTGPALSYEYGIVIAVVSGIFLGVIVGLTVLTLVIICYRRTRTPAKPGGKVLYWQCPDQRHVISETPCRHADAIPAADYDRRLAADKHPQCDGQTADRSQRARGSFDSYLRNNRNNSYEKPTFKEVDCETARTPSGSSAYYGQFAT